MKPPGGRGPCLVVRCQRSSRRYIARIAQHELVLFYRRYCALQPSDQLKAFCLNSTVINQYGLVPPVFICPILLPLERFSEKIQLLYALLNKTVNTLRQQHDTWTALLITFIITAVNAVILLAIYEAHFISNRGPIQIQHRDTQSPILQFSKTQFLVESTAFFRRTNSGAMLVLPTGFLNAKYRIERLIKVLQLTDAKK